MMLIYTYMLWQLLLLITVYIAIGNINFTAINYFTQFNNTKYMYLQLSDLKMVCFHWTYLYYKSKYTYMA